ncbi:alpha/beta hydrolase [Bacillus nakamurai]|uniref:alpha/beta hydrolase n=1 Tax=Bacillus nakamurai TaxID=1793963 RepID=UPI001E5BE373|nr:alpha/beta hydrolase-fold protein [Bacillus nakamurai]MCC9024040.1 alpha/beta hydrolase [Bacillus nakamurai]
MRGSLMEHRINGRTCTVYLPPSYSARAEAFLCVYVLDGGYLFLEQIDFLETQFAQEKLPELIFAGIEPDTRLDEYTPWPAPSLSPDYQDFGGKGDLYLYDLTHHFIPMAEEKWNISKNPRTRGLIGASLGGLFSMYAFLQKPGVFGRIGSLSGSFWYEKAACFVRSAPLRPKQQRIYMSVGSREAEHKNNIQNTMVKQNIAVHESLKNKGFSPSQLMFTIEKDAVHHQEAFIKQFVSALNWLYGKNRSRG